MKSDWCVCICAEVESIPECSDGRQAWVNLTVSAAYCMQVTKLSLVQTCKAIPATVAATTAKDSVGIQLNPA